MSLLYSPTTLPSFCFLVAALDYPPARELARYLHVSERTIYSWLAADKAPMAARLALFWITHYGRSEIECHAQNGWMHYKMLSDSLGNVVKQQRARIDWLERHGQFGAANNPYFLSDSCAEHKNMDNICPVVNTTAAPQRYLVVKNSPCFTQHRSRLSHQA